MNKTIWIVIIILVIAIIGIFAFTGDDAVVEQRSDLILNESVGTNEGQMTDDSPISDDQTGDSTFQDTGDDFTVSYTASGFSPASLTVPAGSRVTFINQGSGAMWVASAAHPTHTVYGGTSLQEHCPDPDGTAFDQCQPGNEYSFTFNKAGEWRYHNHMGSTDTGVIIVE